MAGINIGNALLSIGTDLVLTTALAGFTEAVFPKITRDNPSTDLKEVGLAFGEVALPVILYLESRQMLPFIYRNDQTASMVAFGLLFAMQPHLRQRLFYLTERAKFYVNQTLNLSPTSAQTELNAAAQAAAQ